ncbi:MAG: hypothetical protein U1F43_14850 [Myxococcota bacterium]
MRTLARASSALATALAFTALALAGACADGAADPDGDLAAAGPATAVADLDSKADGTTASEIRVRAGEMTVWITARAVADTTDRGARIVVSGRASRDLESTFSWIPDDEYAEAIIVSKRRFQLILDESYEVRSLLSGQPIFITLRAKSGEARDYYLRLALEPRFTGYTGSSKLWLADLVKPVFVRDGRYNVRYRGQLSTRTAASALSVATHGGVDPIVRATDATHADLDWAADDLVRTLTDSKGIEVTATLGGKVETKKATLVPMVANVALSIEDPYTSLMAGAACTDAQRTCIAAANGADDLGACGTQRDVALCLAQGPICGTLAQAPALLPVASSELQEAVDNFGALAAVDFYRLPVCLAATPTLADVVALALGADASGQALTRDELRQRAPFSTAGDGPTAALLGTLDNWAGSYAPESWLADDGAHIVLYYASVGRAFVLQVD